MVLVLVAGLLFEGEVVWEAESVELLKQSNGK